MPSYACSGDTVFVEGKGCRQACSVHEIAYINGQILSWKCSKKKGGAYNGNSSHILAEDFCELLCPENYIPYPYKSTECQNDGSWRNRNNLGCVKSCPALPEIKGTLFLGSENLSLDLKGNQVECYHIENGRLYTCANPKQNLI